MNIWLSAMGATLTTVQCNITAQCSFQHVVRGDLVVGGRGEVVDICDKFLNRAVC